MMLATVRDVVNQVSLELGFTIKPIDFVVGSNDQDVGQMVALLSAVADEVLAEDPYRLRLGDGVWLQDINGNPVPKPGADTDVILFDSRLAINGLKFRFLKAKGLEFGEEMRDFSTRMSRLAARANHRVLDLYTDAGVII